MTTIVANRKGMAADRRGTSNPVFKMTKLFRVNGSIIGITGNVEQALRFVEWRRTPEGKPTFNEASNIEVLELTADGRIIYWGAEMVGIPIENEFYALGTGAMAAMGAMSMGASPKRAVAVAALWDAATGPDVQVMTLGGK
jgi:hypothetical protein